MQVDEIVDLYVRDVAERLPRRQRADLALELRSLLGEELAANGHEAGGRPDADAAIAFLETFGHPRVVAHRYQTTEVIVSANDTRSFLTAGFVGVLLLAVLAKSASPPPDAGLLQLAVFAWLGLLVCCFGVKGWLERRWSFSRPWVPRDRDKPNMTGTLLLIGTITVATVVYGAPAWVFAKLTNGGTLSEWLGYDSAFHSGRLPWLLGLWILQATLLGVVASRGRWTLLLRRIELALSLAVVVVLAWFIGAGSVFAHAVPNEAARSVLGLAIVVICLDIGSKIHRGLSGRAPWHSPTPIVPGPSA